MFDVVDITSELVLLFFCPKKQTSYRLEKQVAKNRCPLTKKYTPTTQQPV